MTPEQLNALQVEQQISTDNYNAINDRIQAIRNLAQDYLKATPEQQARAKWAMQQLMNEYSTLNWQINDAFWRMNAANENYNNAIAQQQAIQQQATVGAGQRRRQVIVPNTETVVPNEVPATPIDTSTTTPLTPFLPFTEANQKNNVEWLANQQALANNTFVPRQANVGNSTIWAYEWNYKTVNVPDFYSYNPKFNPYGNTKQITYVDNNLPANPNLVKSNYTTSKWYQPYTQSEIQAASRTAWAPTWIQNRINRFNTLSN